MNGIKQTYRINKIYKIQYLIFFFISFIILKVISILEDLILFKVYFIVLIIMLVLFFYFIFKIITDERIELDSMSIFIKKPFEKFSVKLENIKNFELYQISNCNYVNIPKELYLNIITDKDKYVIRINDYENYQDLIKKIKLLNIYFKEKKPISNYWGV